MIEAVLENVFMAWWTPHEKATAPSLSAMRSALAAEGFDGSMAKEIPITTSFTRAIESLAKTEKAKATFYRNGSYRGQLEHLGVADDLITHSPLIGKSWKLADKDTGRCDPDDLTIHLMAERVQYDWSDVTKVIQTVLEKDGLGAHSLKKNGSIYACPVTNRSLLDRLKRASDAIGLKFLITPIPGSDDFRDEVSLAVSGTLDEQCAAHATSLDSYSPETSIVGRVENRVEAIRETRRLADKLAVHIGDRAPALLARIDALMVRALTVLEAVKAAVPNRPTSGGRRISFSKPQTVGGV